MKLTGLHILLTYQCNLECAHCFAWGSPWQSGTLTLNQIEIILQQSKDLGTVKWIYFEGGEPFLYYPILVKGVQMAAQMGFQVGLVTNSYWGTSIADSLEWLLPFKGLVHDLSVSSDLFHWSEKVSLQTKNSCAAADQLGIPIGVISIAQPEDADVDAAVGQLPPDESGVMYRGRASTNLVSQAPHYTWTRFDECPYEDLREPGRLHLDPLGILHICQGISVGNLFQRPLREICDTYDPDTHPITGPMLVGGPAELVRRYSISHEESYADACHLCYQARIALRNRFPEILSPDQMYGEYLD